MSFGSIYYVDEVKITPITRVVTTGAVTRGTAATTAAYVRDTSLIKKTGRKEGAPKNAVYAIHVPPDTSVKIGDILEVTGGAFVTGIEYEVQQVVSGHGFSASHLEVYV